MSDSTTDLELQRLRVMRIAKHLERMVVRSGAHQAADVVAACLHRGEMVSGGRTLQLRVDVAAEARLQTIGTTMDTIRDAMARGGVRPCCDLIWAALATAHPEIDRATAASLLDAAARHTLAPTSRRSSKPAIH